jgi:hypothetical protein
MHFDALLTSIYFNYVNIYWQCTTTIYIFIAEVLWVILFATSLSILIELLILDPENFFNLE